MLFKKDGEGESFMKKMIQNVPDQDQTTKGDLLFGTDKNSLKQKLIRYEFPDNKTLVHKESGYPILQDSQLIVGPSQTVLMVRNGQIVKRYESGAQVLDTGVLWSTIKAYAKTYEGGEIGVPVDLYFINNLFSDVLPWGLPDPIQIYDSQEELYLNIISNGQLRYQIVDPELYIQTNLSADVADLNRLCKQKVLAHFAQEVQNQVQKEGIGYRKLASQIVQVSDHLKDVINAKIVGSEGFKIVEFTVAAFRAKDEDLEELKKAQAKKRVRETEGYTYHDERRFDVWQEAAGNQGNMGGVMGTMMGAAMGGVMGAQIGSEVMPQAKPAAANAAATTCPHCSAAIPAGSKFCPGCGKEAVAPANKFCTQCGAQVPAGAKFCPGCGTAQA